MEDASNKQLDQIDAAEALASLQSNENTEKSEQKKAGPTGDRFPESEFTLLLYNHALFERVPHEKTVTYHDSMLKQCTPQF